MSIVSKLLKFICCLLILITEVAFAWRPHHIVVFGDSLSDNGNKYQLYQIPLSPPYWHGRYSNGPVWVEDLAFQFNLVPNPLIEPNYPRSLGLQDYAVGDSTVLEKNQTSKFKSRSLLEQFKTYQSESHPDPRDTLVIIWDGSNDYKSASCQASPFSCTKEIIRTQVKLINSLYEFGLRHFLILSLPSLSITPQAHEYYDIEQREVLRGMIRYYNNNLALAISQLEMSKEDIDIASFDVNDFIHATKRHFNQPIYTACYNNHNSYTKLVGIPCPAEEQSRYFFWDDTHPTAAASAMLADAVYDQIRQLDW